MKTFKTLFAVAAPDPCHRRRRFAHGYSVGALKIGHPFPRPCCPARRSAAAS